MYSIVYPHIIKQIYTMVANSDKPPPAYWMSSQEWYETVNNVMIHKGLTSRLWLSWGLAHTTNRCGAFGTINHFTNYWYEVPGCVAWLNHWIVSVIFKNVFFVFGSFFALLMPVLIFLQLAVCVRLYCLRCKTYLVIPVGN